METHLLFVQTEVNFPHAAHEGLMDQVTAADFVPSLIAWLISHR
jgi:hypothetical protein